MVAGGVPAVAADGVAEDGGDAAAAEEKTGGNISGKVRWARGAGDGQSLSGARVVAYHVGDRTLHVSEPVRRNGGYAVRDLPRGFYDLAVEVGQDIYVATEVVHLGPGVNLRLDFDLGPFPGGVPPADREAFLGTGAAGSGLASADRKPRGREFWFSPKGLVILSTVGGAALLGIALSTDDKETAASPIVPQG